MVICTDVEIESPRFVFHLWEVFLVDTVSQRGFKFLVHSKMRLFAGLHMKGTPKSLSQQPIHIHLAGNLQHLVPQSCNIVFESVTSGCNIQYPRVKISSVSPSRACLQNVFIVNMQTGRTFAARETGLKFLQRKVG